MVGAYTVTYTSAGVCPTAATFNVIVQPQAIGAVAYPQATYCQTLLQPVPTVSPAGGQFSGTAGLVIDPATGVVNLAASVAGAHVITYTPPGPCPVAATFNLTITPLDAAAVAYAQAVYCQTGTAAPLAVGPAGGTFSGTFGLSIDPLTGVVNLAASAVGPHTVTYTSAGPCPASATATFRVEPLALTALSFPQAAYCQQGSTTAPTFSPPGGTFAGSAGLSINPATGVIDLVASTTGSHTVTYTSAGLYPTAAAFALVVNQLAVGQLAYVAAPSPPTAEFCQDLPTVPPVAFGPPGGRFRATGGLAIDSVTGVIRPVASGVGSYTVTYTPAGPCPVPATVAVRLLPRDVAALRLADSVYCQAGTSAVPVALPSGGVFYSPSPALVLDPATGVIDLARTPVGRYELRYLSSGPCPAEASVPVRIRPRAPATVAYADTLFCPNGAVALAAITPAGAGIFTGSTGLVLNQQTGAVDVAASTPGPHSVTFTSADRCFDPATARFTIGVAPLADLPNVITPNQDGLNETFGLPQPAPAVSGYELAVFNRWGGRVYRSTDPAAPWAAPDAAAGTYFYHLRYTDCGGKAAVRRGWVEVVR